MWKYENAGSRRFAKFQFSRMSVEVGLVLAEVSEHCVRKGAPVTLKPPLIRDNLKAVESAVIKSAGTP
jgi:hypothetical protein